LGYSSSYIFSHAHILLKLCNFFSVKSQPYRLHVSEKLDPFFPHYQPRESYVIRYINLDFL